MADNNTQDPNQNMAADKPIPEYRGPTKRMYVRDAEEKGAVKGELIGGALGLATGAAIGNKVSFVQKLAKESGEFLEIGTHSRATGAIVFAAAAAVTAAIIGTFVGHRKGAHRAKEAKQQHVELYERLNQLEANQQQGASRG